MGMGPGILLALSLWATLLPAQLPESARSRMAEAAKLVSAGQFARAERILIGLEKSHPQDPEIQYRLGLVLLRQQKLPDASVRLESAAKLNPQSALVWLAAAQVRLRLGNRSDALQAAERANSLAPEEPVVSRALAMFYAQIEDFAKAAEHESRWSRAAPQDASSPARSVEYYIRAGDATAAIEAARKALAGRDSAVLRNLLGKAYRLNKNPALAVEEMQRAIRLDPDQPGYYADLAQLFLDHRTPEPAVLVLEQAAARFPKHTELLRLLGLARYGTGDAQKALDAFLKMTDLEPDSETGYVSMETLLPAAGPRLPEIIRRLRGFCERRPAAPVGYLLLAQALAIQPDGGEEVEALLRKAIAVEPKFWPAYFELHKPLLARGNLKQAAEALEKAVELNPDFAPAHYSLAQVYGQLGDRERAIEQRKLHHRLLTRQREAAEARRAESPALPYTVRPR